MDDDTNPVTLPELSKALDALVSDTFGIPLADDDITISRLSEKANCTWDTARQTLKKWEAAGKVEYIGKRRAPSGKMLDAWKIKAKQPAST